MARAHANLLTSRWADDDWRGLTASAQRVYDLVLTQAKLSLAGAIDYLPGRWASLAADTTIDDIDAAVDELAAARFVFVDRSTHELAVRTFTKHDLPARPNINQLKGVWSAWAAVTSARLRHELVLEFPDNLWTDRRCPPPAEALRMRDPDPDPGPLDPEPVDNENGVETHPSMQVAPVETTRRDEPSEQPVATYRQPLTPNRQPSAAAAKSARSHDPVPLRRTLTAGQRADVFAQAIVMLTDRYMATAVTRGNSRTRHYRSVHDGKLADYCQAGHQLLVDDPTLTADALAELLEPAIPFTPPTRPEPPPAWVPVVVPDALDHPGHAKALRAVRSQHQAVAR